MFGLSSDDDSSSCSSESVSDHDIDVEDDQVGAIASDYNYSSSDESESDIDEPLDLVSLDDDEAGMQNDTTHQDVHIPFITQPPSVLEPSVPILKSPTIALMMRHRGFCICGDNIDKMIHRRHMRSDRSNLSLHYFNSYAVENRVNFTELSDKRVDHITDTLSMAESLLPTKFDDAALKENVSVLVSRVLCTHLTFFHDYFKDVVDWHIKHKYYAEMAKKSLVVNSSILLHFLHVHVHVSV